MSLKGQTPVAWLTKTWFPTASIPDNEIRSIVQRHATRQNLHHTIPTEWPKPQAGVHNLSEHRADFNQMMNEGHLNMTGTILYLLDEQDIIQTQIVLILVSKPAIGKHLLHIHKYEVPMEVQLAVCQIAKKQARWT